MDREAWRAAVHGVTKSQTRLSHWRAGTLLGVTVGSGFGASRADACWTPRSTLRMAVTSLFSPAGGGGGGFQPGHDGYGNRLASCSAGARGAGGAAWAFPGLPLELPPGSWVWAASLLTVSLVSSRCPGLTPHPCIQETRHRAPGCKLIRQRTAQELRILCVDSTSFQERKEFTLGVRNSILVSTELFSKRGVDLEISRGSLVL